MAYREAKQFMPRVKHGDVAKDHVMPVAEHRRHLAAMDARGGLSAREQDLAKRMAAAGSTAATIRVELGARYSVSQIERALRHDAR